MVIKNLENKIKLVMIICILFLAGCIVISLSSIWMTRSMVVDAQQKISMCWTAMCLYLCNAPPWKRPRYAERYEKEVCAGRKWVRLLKIDKAARYAQCFACRHPKIFLTLVFGIVIGCLTLNICRMVQIYNRPNTEQTVTATQHQEELLKKKRNKPIIKTESNDPERIYKQD